MREDFLIGYYMIGQMQTHEFMKGQLMGVLHCARSDAGQEAPAPPTKSGFNTP